MLDAEPLDSYVLVRREDVLEAIGAFVAAYLAELPEAQNLQPAQLQAALKTTFKVCAWGLSCIIAAPAGARHTCCSDGTALPAEKCFLQKSSIFWQQL